MILQPVYWKFIAMPELPEVETVARTLYPHVHNCLIQNVEVLRPASVHPLSLPMQSLCGCKIANVRRRAKLLIFDLDSEQSSKKEFGIPNYLIAHLRMTGRIFTQAANTEQGKHTRCRFMLTKLNGEPIQLFFDDVRAFGQLLAATPQILEQWQFWQNLGPEPLEIDQAVLASRLGSRRQLKTCLMDQKVLAGIGNIYADEALFQAGIDPAREACSLDKKETGRLLKSIKDVLNRSISQCGSSIRDYRDADGNVGAFQNSFAVYGRGGKICKKCGHILHKIRIGGRATVFCPVCQK